MRRRHFLTAVLFALALAAIAAVAAASIAAAGNPSQPPGGVYTCAWIAQHPVEAAQAAVSCNGQAPPIVAGMVAPTFVAGPLGEVCQRIPSSNAVGKGVFAWTPSYYYSYQWYINGYLTQGGSPNYTWYVQNQGGTNVFWANGACQVE